MLLFAHVKGTVNPSHVTLQYTGKHSFNLSHSYPQHVCSASRFTNALTCGLCWLAHATCLLLCWLPQLHCQGQPHTMTLLRPVLQQPASRQVEGADVVQTRNESCRALWQPCICCKCVYTSWPTRQALKAMLRLMRLFE